MKEELNTLKESIKNFAKYTIGEDCHLIGPNGRTSVKVQIKRGRLYIIGIAGEEENKLFTGRISDGLPAFLKKFWRVDERSEIA